MAGADPSLFVCLLRREECLGVDAALLLVLVHAILREVYSVERNPVGEGPRVAPKSERHGWSYNRDSSR